MINQVRELVPLQKQWTQLAEEAVELAHAALKVARTLDDENPTPVSYDEAMEKVQEEIADVELALRVLDLTGAGDVALRSIIMSDKLSRWVGRLNRKGGNHCGDT